MKLLHFLGMSVVVFRIFYSFEQNVNLGLCTFNRGVEGEDKY